MIYEVSFSSGKITEYESLEEFLNMLNEDRVSPIEDSCFFQSLNSAQHKQGEFLVTKKILKNLKKQ